MDLLVTLAVLTLQIVLLFNVVMFIVLALVWLERKVLGRIHQRMGPMRVGPHGTLQSLADGIKLLLKEDLAPSGAERLAFLLAPLLVFAPSFLVFVAIPFTRDIVVRNLDLGLVYFVAVSSLSTVGMVLAGWSSSNKYALIGAARTAAQLISYEIPLVLVVLSVAMLGGTLDLRGLVESQGQAGPYVLWQPLGALIFIMAALAEVFRPPFDIPVAESEVLGGPMIEYSGMRWGLFFMAEYGNAFAFSALFVLLFLGGWQGPLLPPILWFLLKTSAVILVFFWMRAAMPRLRIDQLMGFAWEVLLPFAFLNLFLTGVVQLYGWPLWSLGLLSVTGLLALGYVVERGRVTWRRSPSLAS